MRRALRAILGDLGESLLQSVLDGPNLLCKLLVAGVGTQQDNVRIAGGLERAREGIESWVGSFLINPTVSVKTKSGRATAPSWRPLRSLGVPLTSLVAVSRVSKRRSAVE